MKRKLYSTLLGALILLSACATEPKAGQYQAASPVPVQQPVYSTGYVTIHTIPEGAMVLVNTVGNDGYIPIFKYLANGYSPLTVQVQLADGLLSDRLVIEATPTAPGQFTQRGFIAQNQQPGDYTFSMYNTGIGAER